MIKTELLGVRCSGGVLILIHSTQPHPALLGIPKNQFTDDIVDSFSADVADALGVQSRMFPAALPAIASLDQAYDWRAVQEVTGDYFDCFATPEGVLCLAIGEVTGGGMAAALMTPVLHSLVRGIGMNEEKPLADMIRMIGETFSRICPEGCLATLLIAEVDSARRRLRYVNAGHEPALVIRTTADRERTILLEATGPMIGMLRPFRYRERVCMLAPGDLLVAMTDGVCDAEVPGGQVWGRDHLLSVIRECEGLPARAIVDEIFTQLDRAAQSAGAQDDMTLWLGRLRQEAKRPLLKADSSCEELQQGEWLADMIGAVA
jgi:phosphoserine phosphatase RsbU/P